MSSVWSPPAFPPVMPSKFDELPTQSALLFPRSTSLNLREGTGTPDHLVIHQAGQSCAAVPELVSTCTPWTGPKWAQREGGKNSWRRIWNLIAPAKDIF